MQPTTHMTDPGTDLVIDLAELDRLIASEIRAQMGRAKVRQAELARRTGIHQSTLSRRLDGYGSFTNRELATIARALGASVNDLWPDDLRNRCFYRPAWSVDMPPGQMSLPFRCLGGHDWN